MADASAMSQGWRFICSCCSGERMKKSLIGYCCASCGLIANPPAEAVSKRPRASEHSSNESRHEYPTEILARIAIESDLAHPPLRINNSRKNYCHYRCPSCSYSASYSKREKVFVVTRSQHAPACSAPKEHKNGERTSHFHLKTVELILAPSVLQQPTEKMSFYCAAISSAYPNVWAEIRGKKPAAMSSRIVARAVDNLRNSILPLNNLLAFESWVNTHLTDYSMKVRYSQETPAVYESTVLVSGAAKSLARQGLLSMVFRCDFSHIYTPKHKGVVGSVVAKVCEQWMFPVVLLHAPSNENLDLWALLLKTLIEEVAPLEPNRLLVVVTDGFPGLAELIANISVPRKIVHSRCVHHLSDSLQRIFRGKKLVSELWRAGVQTHLNGFIQSMHAAWIKNPKPILYLCRGIVSAFTDTSIEKHSDRETHLIFSKMAELQIDRTSTGPLPTRAEMMALCAVLFTDGTINPSDSTSAIYSRLANLLSSSSPSASSSSSASSDSYASSSDDDETFLFLDEEDRQREADAMASALDRVFEMPASERGRSTSFELLQQSMPFNWCSWQLVLMGSSLYGDVSSNSAESFNSHVAKARKYLPTGAIVHNLLQNMIASVSRVLESITADLSSTTQISGLNYEQLTPKSAWDNILKRLEKAKAAPPPYVLHSNDHRTDKLVFKSTSAACKFRTIDVKAMTCECLSWQGTGYPCKHALAAVQCNFFSLENAIPNFLNVRKVRMALEKMPTLAPLPESFTSSTVFQLHLPPEPPKVGRPKRSRHKSILEKKAKRGRCRG